MVLETFGFAVNGWLWPCEISAGPQRGAPAPRVFQSLFYQSSKEIQTYFQLLYTSLLELIVCEELLW